MNNQLPNSEHQINSLSADRQAIPNVQTTKLTRFGKLSIGHWLLFGYWCLVIGISNGYAFNIDKVKISFLNGDYKAAIIEGEKILAAQPEHSNLDELYYMLGLSYLKDGNYLRASDIFEIILKEFKDSKFQEEAQLGLGDSYFLRGDDDRAEFYYKELINKNPHTKFKAQLYYRLTQTAFKKGNKEQGEEYLGKLKRNFPQSPEVKLNSDLGNLSDFSSVYYTVQVGAFAKKVNAENLTQKLISQGYPAFMEEAVAQGNPTYKVKVGKLNTRREASNLEEKLTQQGYPTKICP